MNTFDSAVFIPSPIAVVWDFFSDPRNLARLTPPPLRLEVAGAPHRTRAGDLVELRLRVFGVPLRWCSLIEASEPERRFVDFQLDGPYRYWRHEHRFRSENGGTWLRDHVEYELPLGRLGAFMDRLWVRRTLTRMFRFRGEAALRLLGTPALGKVVPSCA